MGAPKGRGGGAQDELDGAHAVTLNLTQTPIPSPFPIPNTDPDPNPHNLNPYPKQARMAENAAIFHFELSVAEVAAIDALAANAPDGSGRLCWVNDPLRMLEFE